MNLFFLLDFFNFHIMHLWNSLIFVLAQLINVGKSEHESHLRSFRRFILPSLYSFTSSVLSVPNRCATSGFQACRASSGPCILSIYNMITTQFKNWAGVYANTCEISSAQIKVTVDNSNRVIIFEWCVLVTLEFETTKHTETMVILHFDDLDDDCNSAWQE